MPDNLVWWVLATIVVVVVGGAVGRYLGNATIQNRLRAAQQAAEQLRAQAEGEQKDVVLQGTKEAMRLRAAAEEEIRERRQEVQRLERRMGQKEENLDRKL